MNRESVQKIGQAYYQAVFDTDRDRAFQIIRQAVADGVSPETVVFEIVVPAIDQMVAGFTDTFDSSIAQHFMATQIAAAVTEEMLALFQHQPEVVGTVILGASAGDFHGLGKRIVAGCLKTQMIEVIDIGVNAPAEKFLAAALEHKAQIIGIAAMMVHTAQGKDGCLGVRRLLQQHGLENSVKIVVGGAPYRFDPTLYQTVQADAWAPNGIEAGRIIRQLIETVKQQ